MRHLPSRRSRSILRRTAVILGIVSALTGPFAAHVAHAQGNFSYAETTFGSGAITGGVYRAAEAGGSNCVSNHVTNFIYWLRLAKRDCTQSQSVSVDLSNAISRVSDSGPNDFTFETDCGSSSTPVSLNTAGSNIISDLIIETESPWKNNALTRGIRCDRVVLNQHLIFCNAFTLVYDRPFRVNEGSSANERVVTTGGSGECTLYMSRNGRQVSLGRFYVPMTYTVKKL